MERLRVLYVHGIRGKPPADEYGVNVDMTLGNYQRRDV